MTVCMRVKINRKTVGAAFFAAVVLLTFFSRTVYAHGLPQVSGATPKNGRLHKRETATAAAEWADVERLYAAVGGTVEEVLVREGQRVEAGEVLMRLSFDRDDARLRLRELQNSRARLQTEIENINLQMEQARRYIRQLEEEEYVEEYVSDYGERSLDLQIRQARERLRQLRESYDYGEAEESEVKAAKYELDALYLQQEEERRKAEEDRQRARRDMEKSETGREQKRTDYEDELAAYELSLQSKKLDLADIALQEEPYRRALEEAENHAELTAPAAGTVLEVQVSRGETVGEGRLLGAVGVGEDFVAACTVPLENTFIRAGDSCRLKNAGLALDGEVESVQSGEEGKVVKVRFSSNQVTAGESFEITFEKESETTYTLVPNAAVRRDNDGYFLYQVKRRSGIMGEEYYLDRLGVLIGDSDADNTAIVQGITFFEPVALLTDKPVSAGETIHLTNEGEFYA